MLFPFVFVTLLVAVWAPSAQADPSDHEIVRNLRYGVRSFLFPHGPEARDTSIVDFASPHIWLRQNVRLKPAQRQSI